MLDNYLPHLREGAQIGPCGHPSPGEGLEWLHDHLRYSRVLEAVASRHFVTCQIKPSLGLVAQIFTKASYRKVGLLKHAQSL